MQQTVFLVTLLAVASLRKNRAKKSPLLMRTLGGPFGQRRKF
jgi:hypothetical protein